MQVVATYEFSSDITQKTLSDMFYKNAPAIIFPYVRAYVSSLTVLSGIDAVNIPTMNLTSIAEDLKENTKKEE